MRYLLIMAFMLTSCDDKPQKFILSDGVVVACYRSTRTNCGVMLWDCLDSIRYECQTNVKELKND